MRDQSAPLAGGIAKRGQSPREKGPVDVPFHASPLMIGHGAFDNLDAAARKGMPSASLASFPA